jgi:hypothetical protein
VTALPRILSNRHSDLIHRFPTLGVLVHLRDETVFLCVSIVEQNPSTELRGSGHRFMLLVSNTHYYSFLYTAAPLEGPTVPDAGTAVVNAQVGSTVLPPTTARLHTGLFKEPRSLGRDSTVMVLDRIG